MRAPSLFIALAAGSVAAAACVPTVRTPLEEIPKLKTLDEVMHNKATAADPLWGKIDSASFTDEDWATFEEVSMRIRATSLKTKDFSKGPEFDALAMKLHDKAEALGTAAAAKDVAGANTALKDMKATCKDCHSQFR